MNDKTWRMRLGVTLVIASAVLYFGHYLIFHDVHHIFIYLIGDIAFLPLEVLLVTMILHQLLERRSRREMLHKLNMVIGAFFAESGSKLLGHLAAFDEVADEVRDEMVPTAEWTERQFAAARAAVAAHDFHVDAARGDLVGLCEYLVSQRPFLLRLLENQNLLEHQSFTDTLWAVFHLADELAHREDLATLPDTDVAHLSGDIKRAYSALAGQWLAHLQHLKTAYPYLFSLAVRTNPFDPNARVEVGV